MGVDPNQEKALVGAFSVIVKPMDRLTALVLSPALTSDISISSAH